MKTYVQRGDTIDVVLAAAITSGTGLLIGTMVGCAIQGGEIGDTRAFQVEGVVEMAKLSTDVVAKGDALYWDEGNKRWTTIKTGKWFGAVAWAAAGNGVTTVAAKLLPGGKDVVEA